VFLPVHFKAHVPPFLAVALVDDEFDGVGEGIETVRWRRLGCDLPIVADRRGSHGRRILDEERAITAERIVRDLNL
jgi:hypothetical protein